MKEVNMPVSIVAAGGSSSGEADTDFQDAQANGRVVACLDASAISHKVIPYAAAIARAFRASLTLLQVLEVASKTDAPPDPVEWDIRRREVHEHLKRLASERGDESFRIDTVVIEGRPAEQIWLWARNQGINLIAVGTHGDSGAADWALGDTARKLVEKMSGALLLVPSSVPDVPIVHYRRILVPLDGSCRAESVLPLATLLAKAGDAELLLAHVIPAPELTEVGPLEAEDLTLKEQVRSRNERVARQYLELIRVRIAQQGISVNVTLRDGDVCGGLARIAIDEAVDLVVLSAHGRGAHADVSCGSVASYLLTHATTPLLIVLYRSQKQVRNQVAQDDTKGRPPGRALL
ncbi:universal stress protein [Allomesorhizobium alhagi]|uniref:UspA domain-containing protein n=1 Tax=Mesorhizobium alhagi CCNWXJ12-2 TaxID=1107882 RepID=H0I2U5_9HYPH|nr:universal stress protein [Mesorhizobium alhagi]EHK52719.1 UspA domain-containing protein [Mesorhizobium alhagi CCNWXJ12-2]